MFDHGQAGGERHMGVENAQMLRVGAVTGNVDVAGGGFHLAFAFQHGAVAIDQQQMLRLHFGPVHAVRVEQIALISARNGD